MCSPLRWKVCSNTELFKIGKLRITQNRQSHEKIPRCREIESCRSNTLDFGWLRVNGDLRNLGKLALVTLSICPLKIRQRDIRVDLFT